MTVFQRNFLVLGILITLLAGVIAMHWVCDTYFDLQLQEFRDFESGKSAKGLHL